MRYLIDTHVLIWYIAGSPKLDKRFIAEIRNPENQVFISKASLWEMVIKVSIGKLKLEIELDEIEAYLKKNKIVELDFGLDELKKIVTLPFHHRDPFDRLIISQAITNNLTIITDDPKFRLYSISIA
jgi:PIN domain nuclease of toxin-antitoxin system